MASETSGTRADHGSTGSVNHDMSSLDPAIATLLRQQAEIQTKLAVLLPQKYTLDVNSELRNLRHKVRVLRAYVDSQGLLERIPVLSEIEEARQLQYQIECMEAACLDSGHDLDDPGVVDSLESLHQLDAPAGFGEWLRRNRINYDVAICASKERQHLRSEPGKHSEPQYQHHHFYKCPDENCVHYIYGFLHKEDRDQHSRAHAAQAKRDSGLSVGDTPSLLLSGPARARMMPDSLVISASPDHFLPQLRLPSGAGFQLPPLPRPTQHSEQSDSLRSYSLTSEASAYRHPRESVESDIDPLLPPLKRSRVGPSRLESIEELRLFRERGPCLRCRILQLDCDSNDPCSSCHGSADPNSRIFWHALGCHRGGLASLAVILVPASLDPGRIHTPAASPLEQCQSVAEVLEAAYPPTPEAARIVQTNLDFDDGFWSFESLSNLPPIDSVSARARPLSEPPSVLRLLASSWNMGGTAYNFWQLLKLSGLMSTTRHAEASSFPALYHAKLLLREALFFDLQQPEPSILQEDSKKPALPISDDYGRHCRYEAVCSCMDRFMQSFETATKESKSASPRHWLSVFFSLCIFSIVRTIMVDMVSLALLRDVPKPSPDVMPAADSSGICVAMHAVYKILVFMFAEWSPLLLDNPGLAMADEDVELYNTASMIIKRDIWPEVGIASTKDFLQSLGDMHLQGDVWHGFIRRCIIEEPGRPLPLEPATSYEGDRRHRQTQWHTISPPPPTTGQRPQAVNYWESAPAISLTGGPLLASPQSTGSNASPVQRHITPGNGSPRVPRIVDHNFSSPTQTSVIRPPCLRPPLRRVYCSQCNEYPDGFRGQHELSRHGRSRHAEPTKRWVCAEPNDYVPTSLPQPAVPLSECRACLAKKQYRAYYNAAAHLRRAHFNPRGTANASSEWPPMTVLRSWMHEVQLSFDARDGPISSDGEDCGDARVYDTLHFVTAAVPEGQHLLEARSSPIQVQPSPLLLQTPQAAAKMAAAPFTNLLSPQRAPLQKQPVLTDQSRQPRHPLPLQMSLPPAPPLTLQHSSEYSSAAMTKMAKASPTSTTLSIPASHSHRQTSTTRKSGSLTTSQVKTEDGNPPNRNRCPYPECGRVFKDLAAHMLTHMEERPEKCPIETCEYHIKGFARKYDKNRHALTHYKGTMVCPFCHGVGTAYEKAFNRADVFKRHLTAVHNVEQTPPNSRRMASGLGAGRHNASPEDSGRRADPATCSICHTQFLTAQDFYEHLDDCVLNVIVPSTPKSLGTGSTTASANSQGISPMVGPGPAVPSASGSRKGSRAVVDCVEGSPDLDEKRQQAHSYKVKTQLSPPRHIQSGNIVPWKQCSQDHTDSRHQEQAGGGEEAPGKNQGRG